MLSFFWYHTGPNPRLNHNPKSMINSSVVANINTKIAHVRSLRITDSVSLFGDNPAANNEALPILVVDSRHCYAEIALQGAQLLRFNPKGQQPWLWLSPYSDYCHGKPIRGGIPLCLPWFGVHQEQPTYPKHGFARTQTWQLDNCRETSTGVELEFSFDHKGDAAEGLFDQAFSAHLSMHLGPEILLGLSLTNHSPTTAKFSWAMHSYICVDELAKVQISGLDNQQYLDNTDALSRHKQQGKVRFSGEVDRAYVSTTGKQTIHCTKDITITGQHCPSCIVWNPGKNLASNLTDVLDSYDQYVCVERGCAFDDSISLAPQQSFNSQMTISKTL